MPGHADPVRRERGVRRFGRGVAGTGDRSGEGREVRRGRR
jgi:hypothetical protein